VLAWWLIAAPRPTAYANVQAFTGSLIGKLIVIGYTWALNCTICAAASGISSGPRLRLQGQ